MSGNNLPQNPRLAAAFPRFYHQDINGPDAGLCAFYACRHFLGKLDFATFQLAAVRMYMRLMKVADAEKMVQEGNDPAIVDAVLAGVATGKRTVQLQDYQNKSRVLIALANKPHFKTCLFIAGRGWFDYDSLWVRPFPIQDFGAFLKHNPGSRYWIA